MAEQNPLRFYEEEVRAARIAKDGAAAEYKQWFGTPTQALYKDLLDDAKNTYNGALAALERAQNGTVLSRPPPPLGPRR